MYRIWQGGVVIVLAGGLLGSTALLAHPGGLDAEGCHNDRKNGGYHCHRGPSAGSAAASLAPSPAAAARVDGAFANCDQARAAGRAPVRRGEPGYGPHLDSDGDGVGCEPWRGR